MPLKRNKRKGNISKSGAITISPKNQLNEVDNQQGQIPIDLFISKDKLTNTSIHFSDEYLHYNFDSSYSNTKGPSAGFPTNDVNSNFFISTPSVLGIDDFSSHRISKNSLKDIRLKKNFEKKLLSFKEENLIETSNTSSFYATSSNPDIVKNLDQPLGKRKVIDFVLENNTSTLLMQSSPFNNYSFMTYYNFSNKRWEKLHSDISTTSNKFPLKEICLGFSPSTFGNGNLYIDGTGTGTTREFISGSVAEPISNFGFPASTKYHGTGSQLFSMSRYIDRPFLLEKIIIEFGYQASGAVINKNDDLLPFTIGNNFFILNQKSTKSNRKFNNISLIKIDGQTSANSFTELSNDYPSLFTNVNRGYYEVSPIINNTYRELVTYAKIILTTTGSYDLSVDNSNYEFNKLQNEADYYQYINSENGFCTFNIINEKAKVEFPCRVANKSKYFSKFINAFVGNEHGSRTLLGEDFSRSFYKNNDSFAGKDKKYNGTSSERPFSNLESPNRYSPYVLMPDDQLIFGFQSLSNVLGNHQNSFYITGDVKVKFIGTPIANYKPVYSFNKEFQTSNNVRSAIIGDTYLTDRFETAPIQLYASSSIDRIITADSTRDLSRSLSSFYSNGDLGTNKKAVLMTNSDIKNVYSDNSLVKDNQQYYFDWRKYGQQSNFIQQSKDSANIKTKESKTNYIVLKKFFNITTGISSNSSISSNSDIYSRITLPFKEV
tara:strand:- start:11802 stop:13952 length:2151 start_codon:yes stop_codon:yes gene_type:complete